jgi:hypothetical protein
VWMGEYIGTFRAKRVALESLSPEVDEEME